MTNIKADQTVLRVENVTKRFYLDNNRGNILKRIFLNHNKLICRQITAVDDVCLEVKRGEAVGIVGKNGSGKSTLLQLICGTLHPSGGIIENKCKIGALLELGSGFNPEFTGRENIRLNATLLGIKKGEMKDKIMISLALPR